MDDQIAHLQRSVRRLQTLVVTLLLAGAAAALNGFARVDRGEEVIRTKGIVIVDDAGRERILIGAPIPAAANRVRTDIARLQALYGSRFPRQYYTEYYPTYRNSLHGMLVMDENGVDRLAIGDSVPDPNIGRRVGHEVGLIMNDERGFERTGYGVLRVDSAYRIVLGLDGKEGREGVALAVDDATGRRALTTQGDSGSIFLGHAPQGSRANNLPAGFHGMQMVRGTDRHVVTPATP